MNLENFCIGALVGIFILWNIRTSLHLESLNNEFERVKTLLGNKEEWELTKYQVEQVKEFRKKEPEFVTHYDVRPLFKDLEKRIEKLENSKNG